MATLYVTEYASVAHMPNAQGQVPQEPPRAEQIVAIGGASAQSVNFQPGTRMVRIHTDAICSVLFGVNPTVTTGSGRLVAGQTEYHGVPEGGGMQVAVIANT
jgi:hypothetical protein